MSEAIAHPAELRGRAAVPAKRGGFFYHYGPQAWIDMVMSKRMIVKQAWPVVTFTYLPILRMTTDAERIDREWVEIRSRREDVRFFDSPRERWRKRYGNFVREVEWALLELRQHFSQAQYEDIVIGTSVALGHENSQDFLDMMNSMGERTPKGDEGSGGPTQPKGFQKLAFEMFNPAGFLTGPAQITSFDTAKGTAIMEVPDCAWHICAAAESLPNPDALPEQGCLLICKGAFEALFDGKDGGLSMEFEPHLPETSCTVRMNWKTDPA
ncbi:MAG: hypothetical protein JRH10_15785 [Deltaproteobacteria bacterium]|nr:hypothetical protein [Deltaproteobacteria bacterium]MBW2445503.1 hypothetical protein [Deltaproteobacteria bacterium]